MTTIKLKVNDKILDKFIWLLNQFSKEDLTIIEEGKSFNSNKENLKKELDYVESGNAKFHTVNEANEILEKVITKHES